MTRHLRDTADINPHVRAAANKQPTVMVTVIRGAGLNRTLSVTTLDAQDRPAHQYFTVDVDQTTRELLDTIGLPGYVREFGDIGVRSATATYTKTLP